MDQPGKVANRARGQLDRENDYFPVPVRAREFGLSRRVQQSCLPSACSSPYSGNGTLHTYKSIRGSLDRGKVFGLLVINYCVLL